MNNAKIAFRILIVICLACQAGMFVHASSPIFGGGDISTGDFYTSSEKKYINSLASITVGASFDWRVRRIVTSAKMQGMNSTCWAFAVCGVMESRILMQQRKTKLSEYDLSLDLSEQQLISNCRIVPCNGISGGSFKALEYWTYKKEGKGPILEGYTGYFDIFPVSPGANSFTTSSIPASFLESIPALPFRVKETGSIYLNTDLKSNAEDTVKKMIQHNGPLYFSFNLYLDLYDYWFNTTGSTEQLPPYIQKSRNNIGRHAVLLIGWDDSKNAWLCKNSWGSFSGPQNDGTFWISYTGHSDSDNLNFMVAYCDLYVE